MLTKKRLKWWKKVNGSEDFLRYSFVTKQKVRISGRKFVPTTNCWNKSNNFYYFVCFRVSASIFKTLRDSKIKQKACRLTFFLVFPDFRLLKSTLIISSQKLEEFFPGDSLFFKRLVKFWHAWAIIFRDRDILGRFHQILKMYKNI